MTTDLEDFDQFMRQRAAASDCYIRGDAGALAELLTDRDPATFMPPSGAMIEGAATAADAQLAGAVAFGPDSIGHFEVLNSGSSGDLAFWAGRQVAEMNVVGHGQPISMTLRTTEVFRRENGRWKLVHRHADIPATPLE